MYTTNSKVLQAKVFEKRAQEVSNKEEMSTLYLMAAKTYLHAVDDIENDEIMKASLVYLSSSCSQLAVSCRSRYVRFSKSAEYILQDVLESDKVLFARQRLSSLKKVTGWLHAMRPGSIFHSCRYPIHCRLPCRWLCWIWKSWRCNYPRSVWIVVLL
jgi:hypothetical protein